MDSARRNLNSKIKLKLQKSAFFISKLFRTSFYYTMPDGNKFKIRHEGQIAKDIFTNAFERSEVKLIAATLKPGDIFVDVGANIGFYSLIASHFVGQTGLVISFEPSKKTFLNLSKNIELNHIFSTNIHPHNTGLGNFDNETLILRRDTGYGDAEKYIAPKNNMLDHKLPNVAALDESEEITVTTLDGLLRGTNTKTVNFIKLDTEGFELFALQGAKETITNSRNIILMLECTPLGTARAGYTQLDVSDFMKSCGLNMFYFDEIRREFSEDDEGLYSAGNIWATADKMNLPRLT
jgi:FkbM family methyltransferase